MPPPPTTVTGWPNRLSPAGSPQDLARARAWQLAQPGQHQGQGVLGHRLGERALGGGPAPLPVDDARLERPLGPGLRQLHPGDLRLGLQHAVQVGHGSPVGPDQAGWFGVQGDGLAAAAADGRGRPVSRPRPYGDAGPGRAAHRAPGRSLVLLM